MGKVDQITEMRQRAADLRQMNAGLLRVWLADRRFEVLTKHRASAFVPGRGSVQPKAVFVAERPSASDGTHRVPFSGGTGRVFEELLGSIGWRRADVYVTYLVKFYPPAGRITTPTERGCGAAGMDHELRILGRPPLVLLGRLATSTLLPKFPDAFTMEHPAYALYQTENLPPLRERFAELKRHLEGTTNAA